MNKFDPKFPFYDDDSDYNTNANSYYKDLGRKNKLIKILSKRIWVYEETLDLTLEEISNRLETYIEENDNLMTERLEQWDKNLEKFPENVELLLQEWLEDGTLDHIINVTIFNSKADKKFVDSEIERLDEKDENLTNMKADKSFVDTEIERLDEKDVNLTSMKADKTFVDSEISDTNDLINQTEENLHNDIEQHGFNLRWNEHLVVDGDWTQALQQALDDSPDDGRTIFIGQDIRIDSTIIWPNIAGDTSVNKPCTIQGMAKNRGSGVIDGYQKGEVAIEFTGDGALFDLRNGNDSETNSSVSFRDINLFGEDKEGSIGINAAGLLGANFENMQFRRFDVGMKTREVFYATFDNLRFFYNLSYGLNVEGEVNHAKFHRCNFSKTIDGVGVRVYYGQTGVVFDGCWFEGNKTGLILDYCMQTLIQGCYFEENTNTIDIAGHVETAQSTVTIIGSNISTLTDSRNSPIYISGNTKFLITLIGNTIHHWRTEGTLIGGGSGGDDKRVVDINNHTGGLIVDYPSEIALGVNENGVFTTQINSSMQVGAGLDITDTEKVAKMEVFNRNGESAGWVQVYEG